MAAQTQKIGFVMTEEDGRWLLDIVSDAGYPSSAEKGAIEEAYRSYYCSIGECEIEYCRKMIENSKDIVLVLSQDLLFGGRHEVMKNLYNLAFSVTNLEGKQKCAILRNISRRDLPIGLQNLRLICLNDSDPKETTQTKLGKLISHLTESGNEKRVLGNISQGQAFSNFFGFFNIVLTKLDERWATFEKDYFSRVREEGVEYIIFRKMVEIIWVDGPNPNSLTDFDVDGIEAIVNDEDLRKKIKENFTVWKTRAGSRNRPYEVRLHRVYNHDKSKAIIFVGQIAPAGNVIGKLMAEPAASCEESLGDDERRHRLCYEQTSQKICDHWRNPTCNGQLFVYQMKNKTNTHVREELFNALDQKMRQGDDVTVSEPTTPVGDMEIRKCHIMNNVQDEFELITRIQACLKDLGCKVTTADIGESDGSDDVYRDVDLIILIMSTRTLKEDDFYSKCAALANKYPLMNLLIIKTSGCEEGCEGGIEMCPFAKELTKLEDGLSVTCRNLEENLKSYIQKGPKHLLDLMMISELYNGLAKAFVVNYLMAQIKNIRAKAEEHKALLKLYELVPISGKCPEEKLRALATHRVGAQTEVDGRKFNTPMYEKEIGGQKVVFFIEYCTPVLVLREMRESVFAPLLTENGEQNEITKLALELQALVSVNEDLRDVVTVVALHDDEDWDARLEEIIKLDLQAKT